jgi:hypothetical protein
LETGGGELIAILQVLAHRTCSLHTSELVQAGLVGSFVGGKLRIDQLEPFFLCCQDRLSPLCLIIFVGFENVSHDRVPIFAIGFTSFSVSFLDCLLLERLGDDSGLFVCLTIFAQPMRKLLALAGPFGILFIFTNLPNFVPDGNQLLFQILLPTPW